MDNYLEEILEDIKRTTFIGLVLSEKLLIEDWVVDRNEVIKNKVKLEIIKEILYGNNEDDNN